MSALTADGVDGFAMAVRFEGARAVLAVGGEVDLLTASALGAVAGALVDDGYRHLILDLAALAFMDATGLGVIAEVAGRLSSSGGALTLRAVPPPTRRILDGTGLSQVVHIEAPDPPVAVPGADDHALAADPRTTPLWADLASVASRPPHEQTDAALRLVTALAAATIAGADGVSVTLERYGQLATVASSNDTVGRMDAHQYATGEGPCLAAATEGRRFHIESVAEEDRWPAFVPRARAEGIASILSTPLLTADRPVGALNIYSNTEGAFGPNQRELAALFAHQGSGILADAGNAVADDQRGQRLADALAAREVIARAQGVLMARHHATAATAAGILHRSARTAEVDVLRYAADIVASVAGAGEDLSGGHD